MWFNWFTGRVLRIFMTAIGFMSIASFAWAETRCDIISNLEKFYGNAELLAMTATPPNDFQIHNAKRTISILISQTDGKAAILDVASVYPDHVDWLDNYLLSWIKYVSAYDRGGARAASQLLASSRYRHNQSDLLEIKDRLGCGASSTSVLSAITQLDLKALSQALGLTNNGYKEGISSITAFLILFLLLIIGSVLLWLAVKYDRYRKDCSVRYSCEHTVRSLSKYGELSQNTVNISRSGACILSDHKFQENDRVSLYLDGKWQTGKVVWNGGSKIGIKFRFRLRKLPDFVRRNDKATPQKMTDQLKVVTD